MGLRRAPAGSSPAGARHSRGHRNRRDSRRELAPRSVPGSIVEMPSPGVRAQDNTLIPPVRWIRIPAQLVAEPFVRRKLVLLVFDDPEKVPMRILVVSEVDPCAEQLILVVTEGHERLALAGQ